MAKNSEENMSYVIFKTEDEEDKSNFQYEVTTEFEILEALVQKHRVDRYGISNEIQNRKWDAIHKEFISLTNSFPSMEDLKTIWKDAKSLNITQNKSVKSLEDSLSHTLGGSKNFEVKQIADDEKTSTTIVLLGNEDHSLDQEDLLSELVTEAGISNLPTDLKEDAEYDELAIEILNAEEPKVVKKRLKYDRKLRFEDNTFAKRQKEIETQIEQFKRSHSEAQNEITELEIRLRSKQAKLDSIQNEIKKYSN